MPGLYTKNTLIQRMERYVRGPAFEGEDEVEDDKPRKMGLSSRVKRGGFNRGHS